MRAIRYKRTSPRGMKKAESGEIIGEDDRLAISA